MHRQNPQTREQQLIRESCASVAYHYPKYQTYQDDLRTVLSKPTRENWLLAGKILKHMNNYHRKKLLKMCPEIFADIDLFTLMVCTFIPEEDTAEFAMKRVPQLRNEQEYKKLLTVIPEKDVKKFIARANPILPYATEEKLQLQPLVAEPIVTTSSPWHPVALLAGFSAVYWFRNNFSIAWPILSGLCALYFASKKSQHNIKPTASFSSIWAPADKHQPQIAEPSHHNNCLLL